MVTKILKHFQKYKATSIKVGGKKLTAILADTSTKRMIGLMHRDSLEEDTCMLFLLPSASREGIWMRNMHFPIDVLWLDDDCKVVDMAQGIKPSRGFDFKTYYPRSDASYVVELSAGFIRKNGVGMKSKVYITEASK